MLCGYPPFNGKDENAIMKKVETGKFSFPEKDWCKVSSEAKNFISKLLTFNAGERYSTEDALTDPFLLMESKSKNEQKKASTNVINKLKKFQAQNQLQKAIWVYMVTNWASNDEKNNLLKIFKDLDFDGDGIVTKEELIIGYTKCFPADDPEKQVDKIMESVDANKSGCIDYTEFVMATMNRKSVLTKKTLEMAFKVFDIVYPFYSNLGWKRSHFDGRA